MSNDKVLTSQFIKDLGDDVRADRSVCSHGRHVNCWHKEMGKLERERAKLSAQVAAAKVWLEADDFSGPMGKAAAKEAFRKLLDGEQGG